MGGSLILKHWSRHKMSGKGHQNLHTRTILSPKEMQDKWDTVFGKPKPAPTPPPQEEDK